jgi:hypothetical protein
MAVHYRTIVIVSEKFTLAFAPESMYFYSIIDIFYSIRAQDRGSYPPAAV